jgi:hypothetical protein
MTVIANTVDTLINWAKGTNLAGRVVPVVELLSQSNEIITDMLWEQGNMPLGNRTSVNVALPTVYSRQLGQAVSMSSPRFEQFDDAMALLEGVSDVDVKLANLSGDAGLYRYRQMRLFMESMSQTFSNFFWYGNNTLNATQFSGMAPRYSTVNSATASNAQNVLDAGGTGSANTSLWLLTHGDMALTGIFPTGSAAGIQHMNVGETEATVTAGYGPGQALRVYRDRYTWDCGISLKDWRWCVRVANIDVNNLAAETGAADLIKLMVKATYRLPSISLPASTTGNPLTSFAIPGRPVFYANRTVRQYLHIQALNKVSNQLTLQDYGGYKVLTFNGIPIRNSDQLLNTEARVV